MIEVLPLACNPTIQHSNDLAKKSDRSQVRMNWNMCPEEGKGVGKWIRIGDRSVKACGRVRAGVLYDVCRCEGCGAGVNRSK